ncbi:MAG: hypothetical protein IPN04_07005 [Rhodoferax sp.]|nr:hypothetical protein [Rhodoferax sp.]
MMPLGLSSTHRTVPLRTKNSGCEKNQSKPPEDVLSFYRKIQASNKIFPARLRRISKLGLSAQLFNIGVEAKRLAKWQSARGLSSGLHDLEGQR